MMETEPMQERQKFYRPGELSTWFKRVFTRSSTPPPAPASSPEERSALLSQRDRERARWTEESARRHTTLNRARTSVAELRALLRDAEAHEAQLAGELTAGSGSADLRIARLERRLREGASESLHTFIHDVVDQLAALRAQSVEIREIEGPPDFAGRRQRTVSSNAASFERRRVALVAAKAAAEAMLLEILPEDEIVARLTALRDQIPEVDPLVIEMPVPLTPYEVRAAQWRAEEVKS